MKNKYMTALIDSNTVTDVPQNQLHEIQEHIDKMMNNIKVIKKCVVLNEPTFDINDNRLFNMIFQDDTGFEACQNEVNINSELRINVCSVNLALCFFYEFNQKIKKLYPDNDYCGILSSVDRNHWTYRFHIIREGQPLWINKDIELYEEPLMYEIF